jgi:hypothetical protein
VYVSVPSAIINDLQLSSGSGLVMQMQISRDTTQRPELNLPK